MSDVIKYSKGWTRGSYGVLYYFGEDTDNANDLLVYMAYSVLNIYAVPDNGAEPIYSGRPRDLFLDWENPTKDEAAMFEMEFGIPCFTAKDVAASLV